MDQFTMQTPLGPLVVAGDEAGICAVTFDENSNTSADKNPSVNLSPAVRQLTEYFEGQRTTFDLKLNPQGTPFQQQVWAQLMDLKFGEQTSYMQMAKNLGDPKVIRAAAAANGKNPIAIIIPCHRVVGSDGTLTGYAGGLHRKKWLLEHESPVTQTRLF